MAKNGQKNAIEIAKLEQWKKDFEKRFDKFVSNDFEHIRKKVDWILWILILGTLIQIVVSKI